eukprot:692369_1
MYEHNPRRNRWENQCIDAKCKNRHNKSRKKLSRKTSNSLKQEFRNGASNLQLFDRLYSNRSNKHYSLQHFLECDNIYDDYDMIINHSYPMHPNYDNDIWQCTRCTYINIERLSSCKMCAFPYHLNPNHGTTCASDHDTNSIASSSESNGSSNCSEPLITTHSSLASYIITNTNRKRIKRKRSSKKPRSSSFKLDDANYKKFKKYMQKRKTSIIAHKTKQNDCKWNTAKQERRKNEAQRLNALYRTLYFAQSKDNRDEIASILHKMTAFIPKKHLKRVLPQDTNTNTTKGTCSVCYCESELIQMKTHCAHCMICKECFVQYLRITITEDEHIIPWLLCPAQDCKAPIHYTLLLQYANTSDLYSFGASFVYKHLQRCSYWLDCPDGLDKKCKFGWIVMDDAQSKCIELKCDACGCRHELKEEAMNKRKDDGFAALIASGVMRECPKCSYPAMKDYGMCNVMHCGKCSAYWNWQTKEFGSSTNEVKLKARREGTLWEPGELSYQQNLQNNDLSQFVALLARNGIKYDPNYRRGT